jgi:hypothetical protein
MKKLFLALLAMASLTAANAQKGTVLTYGDITFATSKDQVGPSSTYATRNTLFGINPGVGYQLSNHSTLGVQGGFNVDRTLNTYAIPTATGTKNVDFENRNTTWGVGAFYRYTQPLGNVFFLFTQVNAGYISTTFSNDSLGGTGVVTNDTKFNGFAASIFPAIGVNVCKGMALNFSTGGIAFATMKGDLADAINPRTTAFGFTFGRQINIGISRNLGGCCHKKHGHMEPGMEMRKHKKEKEEDGDDE